jgi:hypothetical protein
LRSKVRLTRLLARAAPPKEFNERPDAVALLCSVTPAKRGGWRLIAPSLLNDAPAYADLRRPQRQDETRVTGANDQDIVMRHLLLRYDDEQLLRAAVARVPNNPSAVPHGA